MNALLIWLFDWQQGVCVCVCVGGGGGGGGKYLATGPKMGNWPNKYTGYFDMN